MSNITRLSRISSRRLEDWLLAHQDQVTSGSLTLSSAVELAAKELDFPITKWIVRKTANDLGIPFPRRASPTFPSTASSSSRTAAIEENTKALRDLTAAVLLLSDILAKNPDANSPQ